MDAIHPLSHRDPKLGFLLPSSPYPIVVGEQTYPSVEHYVQCMRFAGTPLVELILSSHSLIALRRIIRPQVSTQTTSGHIRREVTYNGYNEVRGWKRLKYVYLEKGLRARFSSARMKKRLFETYPHPIQVPSDLQTILYKIRREIYAKRNGDIPDTIDLSSKVEMMTSVDMSIIGCLMTLCPAPTVKCVEDCSRFLDSSVQTEYAKYIRVNCALNPVARGRFLPFFCSLVNHVSEIVSERYPECKYAHGFNEAIAYTIKFSRMKPQANCVDALRDACSNPSKKVFRDDVPDLPDNVPDIPDGSDVPDLPESGSENENVPDLDDVSSFSSQLESNPSSLSGSPAPSDASLTDDETQNVDDTDQGEPNETLTKICERIGLPGLRETLSQLSPEELKKISQLDGNDLEEALDELSMNSSETM